MTRVSATVNPSSTLDSSMNFFHPQSCSFLQKRCRVSEYLLFFGSLFTTAIVNCAKWLQPERKKGASGVSLGRGRRLLVRRGGEGKPPRGVKNRRRARVGGSPHRVKLTGQEFVVVRHAEEERQVVVNVASLRIHQDVPVTGTEVEGIDRGLAARPGASVRNRVVVREIVRSSKERGARAVVRYAPFVVAHLEDVASKLAL